MNNALTAAILVAFILAFILVSYLSKRSPQKSYGSSSENFIIGGRGIGTIVLVLSMGATYFSTWTLLGAFGAYYRSGVWFAGFAVWTIFHAIFIGCSGLGFGWQGKNMGL